MKFPTIQDLLALAAFSVAAVIPFHPGADEARADYLFEVRMASPAAGEIRLYFDDGSGLRESLAAFSPVSAGTELVQHRMRVPATALKAIRFDPLNAPATLQIEDARIVAVDGTVIHTFAPADFRPEFQIEAIDITGNRLAVTTTPGGIDPQLRLTLDPPLRLVSSAAAPLTISVWRALILFATAIAALVLLRHRPFVPRIAQRVGAWLTAHPGKGTALVALIAALMSCHPVVFLGRSFTSPNFSDGTILLYERFPTLPGYTDTTMAHANGSDVGAIAWHHHPLSIIEHRAVFRDGEIPLWNRYDSGGVALLGQGQSMFGDPLHVIPIIANGAAWAWDLKYVVARWLFACGLGLIVLQLTRHTPSALITAFSSAFIGFFLYRVNHPANFSLCYAPWMLYAWVRIAHAPDARRALPWIGALVIANHAELASGTAKEAYMLLLGLNFTGTLLLLAHPETWRVTLRKLLLLCGGGVLFVMLSAPIWVTFLDALGKGYTSYNNPAAFQILPSLLLGLFDELFYRPLHQGDWTLNPSVNFVVLAGLLYAAATIRRMPFERMFPALALGAAVPFAFAFGIVPPQWIVRVPFLANVAHIDNSFSCVLIVHLIVLAGYGYRAAAARLGTKESRGDILVCGLLLLGLIIPYFALTQTVHREPFGAGTVFKLLSWGQKIPFSPFVWVNLILLPSALVVLLIAARRAMTSGRWTLATILAVATCSIVLFWRHGQQVSNAFRPYVYAPAVRVDFHAASPAIEHVKAQSREPWRIVGFEGNLFPGWSAAYDLESISGPDAVTNPVYRQFIESCGLQRIWDWRVIIDAESLARLHHAYDALGVRYYLDLQSEDPRISKELQRVLRSDFDVYESTTAWPRAFFTDRVATYADTAEIGRFVLEGDGRPFAAMQAGDAPPAGLASELAGRAIQAAANYALTVNTTSFTVEAPGPGVIVLHEAWLKDDFRVTVNGRTVPYFRVNHAFKGVAVDQAGTYRVAFSYWPRRLTATLVASCLAALTLATIGAMEWRRALRQA